MLHNPVSNSAVTYLLAQQAGLLAEVHDFVRVSDHLEPLEDATLDFTAHQIFGTGLALVAQAFQQHKLERQHLCLLHQNEPNVDKVEQFDAGYFELARASL